MQKSKNKYGTFKPEKQKIVLAGTYDEYDTWMRRSEKSPKNYKYVSKIEHLHGLSDTFVILVGDYRKNSVYNNPMFIDNFNRAYMIYRPK